MVGEGDPCAGLETQPAPVRGPRSPGLIAAEQPIAKALESVKHGGDCTIVDAAGRTVGAISDWEIRLALLQGVDLRAPVSDIMAPYPSGMDETATPLAEIPVVVLAGGLGTRLYPHTLRCPKPLVDVGGRPLLEITIRELVSQGFRQFHLAISERTNAIRRHFGDGQAFGASIAYLEESTPLGTAGPLSLLGPRQTGPVLLLNGDILTTLQFGCMITFHRRTGASGTVAVHQYNQAVPFGVVKIRDGRVVAIQEKPVHRYFVNAGVYVLEPRVLELVPAMTRIDMPTVLNALTDGVGRLAAYPLHEYWLDVGEAAALRQANEDIAHLGLGSS